MDTADQNQFELNEDQLAIQEMARGFAADFVAPHALQWDRDKHFPIDVIKETGPLGMGGIYVRDDVGDGKSKKDEKGRPLGGIPFMMMAFYLFLACAAMQVLFSFLYPVVHTEQSGALYWRSIREPLAGKGWPGFGNYKFLSLLLLLVMGALYWVFK